MVQPLLWAAAGTGFTFAMTSLGAATVFFFRDIPNDKIQRVLLGFAAGVMTAAWVWSLLLPAIDQAGAWNIPGWIPAAGVRPLMPWLLSFAAGAMLYAVVEELVPQAHSRAGSCGFVVGFFIMMVLDVALG
ncbi:MAG: hypothetical protein VB060_03105 [Oscillibacter sp.]|nr:hypothetical protein [Oscillibacter sp.]MEA4992812.1 hypothetical protein [Oscillibacter sp.]